MPENPARNTATVELGRTGKRKVGVAAPKQRHGRAPPCERPHTICKHETRGVNPTGRKGARLAEEIHDTLHKVRIRVILKLQELLELAVNVALCFQGAKQRLHLGVDRSHHLTTVCASCRCTFTLATVWLHHSSRLAHTFGTHTM